MSEQTFLITYTGKDVVELKGAGLFASGICAFVDKEIADAAKGAGDFKVEAATPAPPVASTREALDAAQQKEMGGEAPAPKQEEAKKEEPKKEEPKKEEAKKEEPKKEEKQEDKKDEKKGDEKKDEEKK